MEFAYVLAALAGLSIVLNFWQWLAAQRFPVHKKIQPLLVTPPPITVLKPLKGCDSETLTCLESWLTQKYPAPIQVLFGVASANDPVCEQVRALLRKDLQLDAQLVICNPLRGPNGKVSTLTYLERVAKHKVVVISDADVFVETDFLHKLATELEGSDIDLLNCLYSLRPVNLPMKLEALAVNADFWSQVLQGLNLKKMDFALGAVMAIRQPMLEKIGGFEPLLELLADDYQLGNRVAKGGGKVGLSTQVVECRSGVMSAKEVWDHQLRWAKTIRACQPVPYCFSILANATVWPLLYLCAAPGFMSSAIFGLAICLRLVTAASNYSRLCPEAPERNPFWLAPAKDLMQFAIWAMSLPPGRINWRGEVFRIASGGKMERVT